MISYLIEYDLDIKQIEKELEFYLIHAFNDLQQY